MKKYLTAIFPLILCAVPSYGAQWSCPTCTKAELQALFEKHVPSDKQEQALQVFNSNLSENGVLISDGIAKTCHATWGRGGLGTPQYKNCETLARDLINLAKSKSPKKSGGAVPAMSQCEADVRAGLIGSEKGLSAGTLVDGLKKDCQFDDTDSWLFKGVNVSVKQAIALAGLMGRGGCRADTSNGVLICENKYAYIFGGIDNSSALNDARKNSIAKAVCAIDAKTSSNNRDMMSFDDNIKGCPTPQVVANCATYQQQLQKINSSLVAKEHKELTQNYCVVSIKKQAPKVTHIDFEEGVEIVANCTPKEINTNIFANASVMPMQAIAMANRYLLKQCYKYQCGEWPEGNGVKCGKHEFRFSSINNSNQGKTANHSISKAFCEIHGGSYGLVSDDYGVCDVSSSVCTGALRADVQMINSLVAVNYKNGQCVLNWGTSMIDSSEDRRAHADDGMQGIVGTNAIQKLGPNIDNTYQKATLNQWEKYDTDFYDTEYFDPDSWYSRPEDENNMQSVMEIKEPTGGRLADQLSAKKPAKKPAPKKPAGTPDTEYKPDGVEILTSGSILPVNEFPRRGEAASRAKQVLKQQTGVDYNCGAPRQHETEILCQNPSNLSVYVKVKFAGFTDSEPVSTPAESPAAAAASGQPSASNVSGTLSDADRQRCLQGALEGQARMKSGNLDIMFMGRGYESISNVDVECSVSDSKCVLNQHATKDGTVVYAHMCINIQIHGTDVCKVSTSANGSSVLFSGSVSSSTSALRTGSKPASVRDCP
ncbi:MAG: hypothetical protein IJL05_01195 [Alphaproteobacteria bacterium]|nr:hypothetical protein [Alphaproteobacteria bacterium]